jgi:glutathione S-transferase
MVVANEKSMTAELECVWTDPWASPAELLAVNPFAKVPALVPDDDQPIIESACICDFLDDAGRGRRLMPIELPQRLVCCGNTGWAVH